ncbi:unnamed protein product [Effrenium voratum]|nr:unnamed protein product [Effrenium voratum]
MLCDCPGRIRWGNARRWKLVQPASPNGSLSCSTQLGDPAPGDAGKHCECELDPTAPFYASVSPAVRENPREPLVSCEILAQAQDRSVWDQKQWQAVRGLCEASDADVHAAGPDSLGVEDLRRMAEAWLDEGCEQNYRRLYKDGWLEEAFVNFIGSSPSGTKWARINEQLIRSVHLFSTRPVVVVHFGMVRPAEWDPSKYPRLVVLHAAPFPTSVFRRFDLNKFRSLLVARVKTGVQLDADQFVAPGVDRLFALARQEGSEDYPLPILPVHFLRNEELPMFPGQNGGFTMSGGQSHVFDRYCKEGKCKVSTRWGHAHPTWTFWSLPFLGTWLRRHLRDETLPESQGKVALRVTHIDVDEDLLNIGTWEEEGYKQWCKYDVMDPSDFERLLSNRPKGHCKPKGPPPIVEDPVFHPEGAAVVFLTAHHAVEPEVSSKLIDQLASKAKAKELPGPVYFKGCFYQDGEELRRAHDPAKLAVLLLLVGVLMTWIGVSIKWACDGSLPARLAIWGLLPEAFSAISVSAVAALLRLKSGPTPIIALKASITDSNASEFAEAIREHGKKAELQALELPFNQQMGEEGLKDIVEAVVSTKLSLDELDLSYNPQLGAGALRASKPLWCKSLTVLRLADCGLTKEALAILAPEAHRLRLNMLDLSGNGLTGCGEVIAEVLEAPVLEELAVAHCSLSLEDLQQVAEQLPYTSLKSLQLAGNDMKTPGLEALASVLPRCALDVLGLERNGLTATDLQCLGAAFAKRPFSRMRLAGNDMSNDELMAFIKTLRSMQA